jgi:hypothetical protein
MVLIVVFFYFNVYLYTLDRNKDFQDVVSRSQQLDADRGSEEATILNAACGDGGGGSIIITFTLINSGSVPIQIVRLWLQDLSTSPPIIGNMGLLSQNIVLQSGTREPQSFILVLPGALADHSFTLRLVTTRSNLIMATIN